MEDHLYWHPQNKKHFDNKVDYKSCPLLPTTKEILSWAVETTTWIDSGFTHGAQGDPSEDHGVKKRSIFYDLPYFGVRILLCYRSYLACSLNLIMYYYLQCKF